MFIKSVINATYSVSNNYFYDLNSHSGGLPFRKEDKARRQRKARRVFLCYICGPTPENMLLTRPGSKGRIANKIFPLFPTHSGYVELFFGAGGMFFNKPRAKYNLLNDIDDEVFNLYKVIQDDRERLKESIENTPWHDSLWDHWKENTEVDPIKKATRFIFLSNMGYMGKADSLRISPYQFAKTKIEDEIEQAFKKIAGGNTVFSNRDFRKVIPAISFRDQSERDGMFIYADPPYYGTENNYGFPWKEQDVRDLFAALLSSGLRFGISEFNSELILTLADENKLFVTDVVERVNLKNRRTEILVTNYRPANTLF